MSIENLKQCVQHSVDFSEEVDTAYRLGLWYKELPTIELERGRCWHDIKANFTCSFVSETGDSWHEFYRLWREKGTKLSQKVIKLSQSVLISPSLLAREFLKKPRWLSRKFMKLSVMI